MIEDKMDLKYQSYILYVCDKYGFEYCAFALSYFIKEIRRRCEADARSSFCSYGLIKNNNKQIAKFEISYKKEQKVWDTFPIKDGTQHCTAHLSWDVTAT